MSAPTPEEIARWREEHEAACLWCSMGNCVAARLADEVERLRAENEALLRHERITANLQAIRVPPPPRTEEEPALDVELDSPNHRYPALDALKARGYQRINGPAPLVLPPCGCECHQFRSGCCRLCAPAPSQPQKATHPYEHRCYTALIGICSHPTPRCTRIRGVAMLACGRPASDPIHAPAAPTQRSHELPWGH